MIEPPTPPSRRTFPASLSCLLGLALLGSPAFAQTADADAGAPEPLLEIDAGPASALTPEAPATTEAADPQADPDKQTAAATPAIDDDVEITIVGTRVARTPGSAQVIKQGQLERFEYDDPHAVLTQVPGVYVRQEDGVGLRPNIGIRGGNPDRSKKLTLMEDGVLFGPAPYSAPAAYYFPLITRMVGVKVIKGPSAIAFGPQTVGGAIDFITRSIPVAPS